MRSPPQTRGGFRPAPSYVSEAALEWRRDRTPARHGNGAAPLARHDMPIEPAHIRADQEALGVAEPAQTEAPRPLRRESSRSEAFPVEALGDLLGGAVKAIIDKIQCPDAIAGNSVLSAASLAAQSHADVIIPATGAKRPLSLFFVTVAASGERKSAADAEALWPVRKREESLRERYKILSQEYRVAKRAYDEAASYAERHGKGNPDAIKAALKALGEEPREPLLPIITCGEPTLEGLHKLFAKGQPSLGLFSDEGGQFIGGHGLSDEARLRTAAGLSALWDGSPVKRVRAAEGANMLPGRRLAMHLMAQPDAAARLLSDPSLIDQGLTSRLLVAAPASKAGTRFQRELDAKTEPALRRYSQRLLAILETSASMLPGERNALDPRRLEFSQDAARRWRELADYVEKRLGPGGELEPIKGFANKLPEHVARIAAVLTLIDNEKAQSIGLDAFERAAALGDYYTTEARRLFEAGSCSPELRQAEKLLDWLRTTWREELVSLAACYQFGPNSIRDKTAAARAVAILEDHGWLVRSKEGRPVVKGKPVREAWRVVKEG